MQAHFSFQLHVFFQKPMHSLAQKNVLPIKFVNDVQQLIVLTVIT